MTLKDIPEDSRLRDFLIYLTTTEVPFSYGVAAGLAVLGATLRRNRWIDQFDWKVYPNQSVMFIGPSGVGKDTVINRALSCLTPLEYLTKVPVLGGVTMEYIYARLKELASPASAVIPAPEITAFFGKADYQQNMLTGITNLLSNNEKLDVSTKGQYLGQKDSAMPRGEQVIHKPTLTMLAGSTVEWLHKNMPEGTMEGGFLGRFLIVAEELGSRHIPLVKADKTREELANLRAHLELWNERLQECVACCAKPREVILYEDAEHLYANWYHNRFKQFSRAVAPYANRSRDTVLRLAMLMAFSRGHYRWVEEEDVAFAIALIKSVAEHIDAVALPPTPEAVVARKIMEMLPAEPGEIYNALIERYRRFTVEEALAMLRAAGKITQGKDGKLAAKLQGE